MTTVPPPGPRQLAPQSVQALLVDTTPWLSCEECFELMDTHVEAMLRAESQGDAWPHGQVPRTARDLAMDRHLLGCAACQEEAQSLLALLTADDDPD